MEATGSIVAFGGPKDKVPQGWLACDGTLYDRTKPQFKPLFEVIGTTWGGDGANRFAVPDLRGLFLRGVSESTDVDPEKDLREPSRRDLNAQGNQKNEVGSKQPDRVGDHTHRQEYPNYHSSDRVAGGGNYRRVMLEEWNAERSVKSQTPQPTETRPKNAYVYYIIKL